MAKLRKPARKREREAMDTVSDLREAIGPVVDAVHARHHCKQHLRCADVRGRLVAADMLLARLDCHAQRAVSVRIARDADDPAGKLADIRLACRDERCVRAAETHRNTEALCAADCDVRAPRRGRREGDERERVARCDNE